METIYNIVRRYFRTRFCQDFDFLAKRVGLDFRRTIGAEQTMCRLRIAEHMFRSGLFDPRVAFQFQDENGRRAVSVTWRAYAPTDEDVHAIGLKKVAIANQRILNMNKERERTG